MSGEPVETPFSTLYESGEYLANVPEWHVGDSRWKAEKVLGMVRAHAPNARSICDVGCGAGEVLAQLQKRLADGVRLVGYDIASPAIALCKPKENEWLEYREGDFLKASNERYDVILALDVFEHIPDYLGFLTALSKRADGFVFHIPLDINATTVMRRSLYMMHMRRTYGHLHYFTAETALATLQDTGYSIVDCAYTWDFEMGLLSRPPSTFIDWCKYFLESGVRVTEYFVNRIFPGAWSRVRQHYNLLVFARPAEQPSDRLS